MDQIEELTQRNRSFLITSEGQPMPKFKVWNEFLCNGEDKMELRFVFW